MSRLNLIAVLAAALVLAALATRVFAAAQGQSKSPLAQMVPHAGTNLQPITIYGRRQLPVPIELQIVKKALKLPWSSNINDYRIRCRFGPRPGSHFKTLWCESNHHHILRVNRLQTAWMNFSSGEGGFPGAVSDWSRNFGKIRESSLEGLLRRIPPADASYTLRVKGGGKPVTDYVIKNGELVKVIEYKKTGQANP